ncbi:MAG: aminotransferase class III-fold pyridoxal phosphate-dependent enzyme [Desulfomonile tiedjei]|uniref:Aminotransferase class III-fold pyridoxal phosphate-dependent enzyme n=1 Tax=Desulfomonile tiedjei TaxID=2358 RepID=A0A9D6V358_9BACT|nr:aminotransferase class III-fold pyridoxal phosphate-dependent enzyme [Desulfomonile tiedjei]
MKTIARDFASDPRVAEAKTVLLETLAEYQRGITGIRPPLDELRQSYGDMLKEFGEIRGAPLFFAYFGSGIGNGVFVELADGSVKYDFISGIGVHHFGHSRPELVAAGIDAALSNTVMQGNLQQNPESLELSEMLLDAANRKGAALKHCFLSTSGAMANENALKLIFQKKHPANRLLAFEGCFAGRTLALSHVTDKPAYREGLPQTLSVDYVPFFDRTRPQESTRLSVEHLKRHLARYPGKHAAMVFEMVLGEGGFYPGPAEFFRALMQILRDYGIAILIDEIQTFGRTTEIFAFQALGLDEFVDTVTLGKSAQVCATLFRADFNPRPGLLSQTFTASTSAIHAARVILRELTEGGYFGASGKIARLNEHFTTRLKEIEARNPGLIRGPFGTGAMIAFTPFGGNPEKVKRFVHKLFDAGVISFYAGPDLSRVRFLLPVGAVTIDDLDAVAGIVEKTLKAVGDSGTE